MHGSISFRMRGLVACLVASAGLVQFVHGEPVPATGINADAFRIILLDDGGSGSDRLDRQIRETQAKIKSNPRSTQQIERLGWLFVQKARVSNDPGCYKLAEQCAICLDSIGSNSPESLLLKGHVLHSLHHFKEAEPLALELTKKRGLAFDFGLLGDVEFDQGKLGEAVVAYQQMVNLRPDLQAYNRIGQVRWIAGDLTGAIEVITLAAKAGSPLNAEPTAWTYSRLATFQLQSGDLSAAKSSATFALELQSNSAPAFFALGRVQIALGQTNEAIESLAKAAWLNHLPESQWLLADVLRAAGQEARAAQVESQLKERGQVEDPRSYAVFLSTRGTNPELAIKLAQRELETRGDVFTHDALAWALHANNRLPEARVEMSKALAEGTKDARLFLHAAIIHQALGEKDEASRYVSLAEGVRQTLYPSELELLNRVAATGKSPLQHAAKITSNWQ